jgi:hypothetical protein
VGRVDNVLITGAGQFGKEGTTMAKRNRKRNGKARRSNGNGKTARATTAPLMNYSFRTVEERLSLMRDLVSVLSNDADRELGRLRDRAEAFSDEYYGLA